MDVSNRIKKSFKSTKKQLTALFVATVTTLSVSFGALPFALVQATSQPVSYTDVTFTQTELDNNWSTDRTTPSGGYESLASYMGQSDVLEMRVDSDNRSSSSSFYYTEGIQREIPDSQTALRADLYVDSSWLAQDVRVGLWGVAHDSSDEISAYPIIEFTTAGDGDFTGWRLWDGVNGGWTNLTSAIYSSDAWNTLQIVFNSDTSEFDYYVNDVLVGSNVADVTVDFGAAIFNNYNYGSGTPDYSVHWSNFGYGVVVPDSTPPSVPVLTSPIGYTNDNTPLMQWEDSTDNLAVAGYYYRIYYHCSDEGDIPTSCSSLYPNMTGVWRTASEYQAGTTPDGTYFWQVRAEDIVGNQSDWSDLEKVIIDTTAPTQPTFTGIYRGHSSDAENFLGCNGYTNTPQIRISWNVNPESNVDYYWLGTQFNQYHKKVYTTQYDANMTPGHNPYYYTIIAVDKAGNESPVSEHCNLILDQEAPVVEITSHNDGDLVTGTIQVRGSVNDSNPDHYYAVVKDSSNHVVAGPGTVYEGSSFTDQPLFNLDTTTLADGNYTLWLAARDAADNRDDSVSLDTVNITVDNTAPLVAIGDPINDQTVSGLVDISGMVTDNVELSHYNLSIYPSTTDLSDGQTHSAERLNDATWCTMPTSGTVSLTANLIGNLCTDWDTVAFTSDPMHGDGEYQIRLAARDAAGNRNTSDPFTAGTSSVHVITIHIDNTAPVADVDSLTTDDQSPPLTGDIDDPTATLIITVDGHSYPAVNDGNSKTWLLADNTISPNLTPGTYDVTVEAIDGAGNISTTTVIGALIIEEPPAAPAAATTVTPTVTTFSPTGTVLGIQTTNDDENTDESANQETGEVLQATDTNTGENLATTNTKQADDDDCFDILGLCWYWWLLIVLGLIGLMWFLGTEEEEK